jgi:hypothetical protein
MRIVLEGGGDTLEDALPLDEHIAIRVDQDVVDRRVAQQRLERSEAEDVVEDFGEERLALGETERRRFFREQESQQRADFALGSRPIGVGERFEIQAVQQLLVNRRAKLEILLPDRLHSSRTRRGVLPQRQNLGRCRGGSSAHLLSPHRRQALQA